MPRIPYQWFWEDPQDFISNSDRTEEIRIRNDDLGQDVCTLLVKADSASIEAAGLAASRICKALHLMDLTDNIYGKDK